MQKINLIVACILSGLLPISYNTQAQGFHGTATLTVKKGNEAPVTCNYPDDFPNTLYNCNQTGTLGSPVGYIDFGFSKTFNQLKNADGDAPIVSVQMRIGPTGKGTFPTHKPGGPGILTGSISVDLNSPVNPLSDYNDNTGGTIIITSYPSAVGDYLVGSFNAKITDGTGSAYYLVSGNFKIERQCDTQ